MKKSNVLLITKTAMFSALIIVMTFVPYLGYITIPGMLSITTLHIPVIIGAIVLNDYRSGTVLGAVWGITCLIYAALNGTADAAIFLNPMISVVPRILVGFLVTLFYRLSLKIMRGRISTAVMTSVMQLCISVFVVILANNISGSMLIACIIGGVVYFISSTILLINYNRISDHHLSPIIFTTILGTLSNTVLVLTAINLFNSSGFIQLTGLVGNIFSVVIALNGSIEMMAAIVIALPCVLAIEKYKQKMAG